VLQLELKKVPVDWRKRLNTIHASAVGAEKQISPSVRNAVNPSGELPLDYALVRAVRDLLSESAEKTLFGGLAGEAGIWDKLVTAYERQGARWPLAVQAWAERVHWDARVE
jgi:hypothetical protein